MIEINYPPYPFKIKSVNGKDQVFDPLRKIWTSLTPEEWVRQNILQYLVQIVKYPSALIAIEKRIQLGDLQKRFDVVVYKNELPWMIIECKEAGVPINEKTFEQIIQYQQVLSATYLIMSNGHTTLGAEIKEGKLIPLDQFPSF